MYDVNGCLSSFCLSSLLEQLNRGLSVYDISISHYWTEAGYSYALLEEEATPIHSATPRVKSGALLTAEHIIWAENCV